MSNTKKTQKELIVELTKVVEGLVQRIEKLEGNTLGDWKPYRSPMPTVSRTCSRCNGTGITQDNDSHNSYYTNSSNISGGF